MKMWFCGNPEHALPGGRMLRCCGRAELLAVLPGELSTYCQKCGSARARIAMMPYLTAPASDPQKVTDTGMTIHVRSCPDCKAVAIVGLPEFITGARK